MQATPAYCSRVYDGEKTPLLVNLWIVRSAAYEEPEYQSMSDKERRHEQCGNEECGSQHPSVKPDREEPW